MNSELQAVPDRIVDFHSHILPGMDDGSESPEMSCAMLNVAWRQGVRTMVATPHFYPEQESPDMFAKRRIAAVKRLIGGGYDATIHPSVCLGAEVAYFPGIARSESLDDMCIVGTRTVLIEMPFNGWTQSMLDEIVSIRSVRGLYPVLAHVDRYEEAGKRALLDFLAERGVLLQINAEMFTRLLSRRRALRWLKEGIVQLIGSDCHNMTGRPPSMYAALDALQGENALQAQLADVSQALLSGALTLAAVQTVYPRPLAES